MAPSHNAAQGRQTAYYRCCLHLKKASAPPNGPKCVCLQNKPSRHALGCDRKMKVVFYNDDTCVECYHQEDCLVHAHGLEESDWIKRKSAVRAIAAAQVTSGYKAPAVLRSVQGADHLEVRNQLAKAGGQWISSKDCHNAFAAWKAANSNLHTESLD